MRLVSPLLKHFVYPGLAISGYLRYRVGAGPAIVAYHGLLPAGYEGIDRALDGSLISAESFRRQLRLLKSLYNVISPEQFLLWCEANQQLPPRSVLLTCDDGLKNTLTDMLPILQELKLSCLFFVTGGSLGDTPAMLWYEELFLMFLAAPETFALKLSEIGGHVSGRKGDRSLWWNLIRRLSQYDCSVRGEVLEKVRVQLGLSGDWNAKYRGDSACGRRFLMLSVAELRRLAAAGVCVGAHTVSHPMLSQLSPDLAWSEIVESRRGLEQALGRPVWALAYPFGHSSSVTGRELEMAERAGFKCAFLNVGGGFGAETPRFAMPRVHVTADMSLAEFEAHVSGFYRSLRRSLLGAAGDGAMELRS